MKKITLLLTLLLCVAGTAWAQTQTPTHYKPGEKKASFAVGDKFFIYCTTLVVDATSDAFSQDRTGFLSDNGSNLSLITEKPYAGATNFHYDTANGASVWTVASVEPADDGSYIKLSIKSHNDKYLGIRGATDNTTEKFVYLQNWVKETQTKPGTDVAVETGLNNAHVAHATIREEDNIFSVADAVNGSTFWNGNVGSFATFGQPYPYAFYTAVDASTEYAPMLRTAQTELNTFINDAKSLATSNYSVTSTTPLTLSTSNLTTNADQNTGGSKDGGGISALFDGAIIGDNAFWHSSWQTTAQNPNDWHYLQVDAGELIDGFNFSYSTRQNGEQSPTSFEIQASVDGTNFDHVITLDEANDWMPGRALTYQKASVTYQSYDIPFSKKYRYVRLVCKSNASGSTLSGYPIFALAELTFNKLRFAESTATLNQKIRYARLQKAATIAEAADARTSTTCMIADVTAVKNELNVHYLNAQRTPVPSTVSLTLTTDESSPVLYHINSGRATNSYFIYKAFNNGMIKLERLAAPATNIYGYWYFMENPKTGYVQLYAYTEPGAPIGYLAVSDGNSKLTNVSTTQNPIVGYDYEVVASNNATYPVALKPAGYNTYVSNHGGEANFMGFYNGLNDGGTRFALVSVEVPAAGDKLIELAQAYKGAPIKTRPADSKFGTTLNTLDVNWKNSFDNTIGLAINSLLTAANTVTSDDVETAMSKISSLSSSDMAYLAYPRMNQPTPGKFYRFKSVKYAADNGGNGVRLRSDVGAVYTASGDKDTKNRLLCGSATDNGRNSIFYLDENNNLVAYVEGQYVQIPSGAPTALTAVGGTGTTVSFMPGKDHASYRICNSAGRSVYCKKVTKDAKDYYFWDFGGVSYGHTDNGYDWTIEEVTWLPVGVNTAAGYGTLKSPVALEQSSARITAYTGTVDGSTLRLSPINGNIPAGTPVVFKYNTGEEDGNVFLQVMTDATAAPSQNNLAGSYVTLPKSTAEAGKVVYTLQQIGGNTGFYQYSGANIQGFRAYLSLNNAVAAGAIGLEFDNAVTGIDAIEFDDDVKQSNIYDLSGRRVNRMTKGMYIVNGQKVLIK